MMKPTALGMYIFAGSFTLGVKQHFKVLAHLDIGYGARAMQDNQPEIPVYVDQTTWPLDQLKGVDFIYGNPPCAIWSSMGKYNLKGTNWREDERINLIKTQFSMITRLNPKIWAWESVPQAFTKGRELVDELTEHALSLGYDVSYVHHNAMYLGSYQNRRRFFLIAHRISMSWQVPEFKNPPNVKEALADYDGSGDKDFYQLASLPPRFLKEVIPGPLRDGRADYVKKHPELDKFLCRVSFGCRKLHLDRPCCAIVTPYLVHPTAGRFLSIGELLHLYGYPPTYKLTGSADQKARLISRGVSPAVGEWLARHAKAAIKVNRPAVGGVFDVDFHKPPGVIRRLR